jgi:hypothetical protein
MIDSIDLIDGGAQWNRYFKSAPRHHRRQGPKSRKMSTFIVLGYGSNNLKLRNDRKRSILFVRFFLSFVSMLLL